jgi:hypothetical protein
MAVVEAVVVDCGHLVDRRDRQIDSLSLPGGG